jgi:hypothetical protein
MQPLNAIAKAHEHLLNAFKIGAEVVVFLIFLLIVTDVFIPLDGVNAKTQYEHEYAIHQLSILPAGAGDRIQFKNLSMIDSV